jgi:hypothetical protein
MAVSLTFVIFEVRHYRCFLIICPEKILVVAYDDSLWGRGNSVCIATRYELDGPVIESRWGARSSAPVQTGPEAYPASCTMGTGSFPGVKRPGRGADHPPHLSAKVMKG